MQHTVAYPVLWQLVYLSQPLVGSRCTAAFTQQRDELVLEWTAPAAAAPHHWRIGFGTFSYCLPVSHLARKRSNSADVLAPVVGQVLQKLEIAENDRVLALRFPHGTLYLAFFGPRGYACWQARQKADSPLFFRSPGQLDLAALSLVCPASLLPSVPPTHVPRWIDDAMRQYMQAHTYTPAHYLAHCCDGSATVGEQAGRPVFCLHPLPGLARLPLPEALATHVRQYYRQQQHQHRYVRVAHWVHRQYRLATARHADREAALAALLAERPPEEIGHLLMANLHRIRPGMEAIELEDLYRAGVLRVQLDPLLPAAEQAARWYRKQKDRSKRLQWLQAQLPQLQAAAAAATQAVTDFQQVDGPEALKAFMSRYPQPGADTAATGDAPAAPFRRFEYQGFEILVGRNATSNDRLTFGYAHKHDLWLHARDVRGSHVVLRRAHAKQEVPPAVLEYAAGLAAWFSKQRRASLATVSYTERKYVRKHKKLAVGQVVLDREQTLLVAPQSPESPVTPA
ncbi:MAG: NFACT RNA binding domain-containing protein [Sphingobacteriia bacterium]